MSAEHSSQEPPATKAGATSRRLLLLPSLLPELLLLPLLPALLLLPLLPELLPELLLALLPELLPVVGAGVG